MRVMKLFAFAFSLLLLSAGVLYAQVLYSAAYQGPDGPSTLYTINTSTGAEPRILSALLVLSGAPGWLSIGLTKLFATCERMDGSDIPVLVNINPNTGVGAEVGPLNS